MRQYPVLPKRPLRPGTTFHQPQQILPQRVSRDDPAVTVMTDFQKVTAITIDPEVGVDPAERVMRRRNVRLLLVVDVENRVLGIVTANDLLGEKTLQYIGARGISRAEALVRDIMTPPDKLEVITMDEVLHAHVGNVVATLKATGRRHAVVVDEDASGRQAVRGLFSASQVAQQLGESLEITEIAQTFAEINAAFKA